MLWAVLAALSGIFFGVLGVIGKELMQETSSLAYTTVYTAVATTLYLPFFLYFISSGRASFNTTVIAAFAVSGAANIAGFLSYNQSISMGDLSEEVPLAKLNPLFTAMIAVPLLGENLSLLNVSGILLVIAGTFTVLVNPLRLVSSLKQQESLKPALIAIFSAVIFSVAAVADRFATQIVDPKTYTMMIYSFMFAGYLPLLDKQESKSYETIKNQLLKHPKLYLVSGMMAVAASLMIFTSFSMAPASKVIPLLQLQVLVSIIAGGKLFKEQKIMRKTLGSTIMITGILFVML
ncbi:MAG: EamA family transporter [Candidatus Nanohaloarchaea archaeon]